MKPMAFFSFVAEVEFLRLDSALHLSRLCDSVLRRAISLSFHVLSSNGSDCFLTAAMVWDLTPHQFLSAQKRKQGRCQ